MSEKFFYKGLPSLNGTVVPDAVFDELMPLCSGAEFKVLCYIVRRTFGFKKESDTISLKQMVEGIKTREGKVLDQGTGLAKGTAAAAVKSLVEKGIIIAIRNRSVEKGDEPTTYQLRFAQDPVSENQTGGGTKIGNGGVRKSDTQTTVKQQTDLQYRNISKSNALDKRHTPETGRNTEYQHAHSQQVRVPLGQRFPVAGGVVERGSGQGQGVSPAFTPLGSLLHQTRQHFRKPQSVTPTPAIKAAITEISAKLADLPNVKANITQTMHIFAAWGKSEDAFLSKLYEAQSITRQQGSVKKPMPYFFKVLRQELEVAG